MTVRLSLAALAAVALLSACDPMMMGGGGSTPAAVTETTATGAPDLDSSELDDGVDGIPQALDPTDDGSAMDVEINSDND